MSGPSKATGATGGAIDGRPEKNSGGGEGSKKEGRKKRKHEGDSSVQTYPSNSPSHSTSPTAGPSSDPNSSQIDDVAQVWSTIQDMMSMTQTVHDVHRQTQQEMKAIEDGNRQLLGMIEQKKRQRQSTGREGGKRTRAGGLPSSETSKRKARKDLSRMLKESSLQAGIDMFGLPERNASAVQSQLVNLLKVQGLTRRHISDFPDPDQKTIKAFMDSNDAVNFSDSRQFQYALSLGPEHPFNIAARAAFHDHFRLTVTKTNWLYQKPFDHRLLMYEIIEEVLVERLKRAKHSWDTRFTFVGPSVEVKHRKRVGSRVYEIRKRRTTALDLHDSVKKYKPVFQSLEKGGLNVHSEDESDDDDGNDNDDDEGGDEKMVDVDKMVEKEEKEDSEIPDVKNTARGLLLWRSRTLTMLLWYLDELSKEHIASTINDNDGIRLGNAFRRRKLFLEFGRGRRVPAKLPINCRPPPMPIEGIKLVKPRMVDDVSMEVLEEFLMKLKDADLKDLDHNTMDEDTL
ncbi:hypothetical protein SCHPADRAFT_946900 [Schizopora paradoxa]|uniref:Uncharacterized protein n=1 Tax=Schizopora paradoxa TaxID=27342 RepID=A0A0H2R103_9AGAM|nr:hypothetical protein SCHPADRAFT_946900 [Schizopora paradoxa]